MSLTLSKPVKEKDAERWIVYIVRNGLIDGGLSVKAKDGNSPEEAIRNAQNIIDDVLELKAEFDRKSRLYFV